MTEQSQSARHTPEMLTSEQLAELSGRIGAHVDRLIEQHQRTQKKPALQAEKQAKTSKQNPFERRGRPAKRIANPFYGLIGTNTGYGRYPFFAQEIIEGIARLDWHDRPIGKGGSSKPLSVHSLMVILGEVEEVTVERVAAITGTRTRQAQRYVKAIELAIPFLMRSRPKRLVFEMGLPEDEFVNAAYRRKLRETYPEPLDELPPPTPEDLAKLRLDLGEDAFVPDQGINAAYSEQRTPRDYQWESESLPSMAA